MNASARAPGYDLFKLIVAVFLLIVALILMWISPSQTSMLLPLTATMLVTPSVTLATTPTVVSASPTAPPLTATASPTETQGPEPSPTPTATPTPEATSPPATETPATACEANTSRSRLKAGKTATILRRLNFRSSAGIRNNWLRTNLPGTQVKVVGGPECVPYGTGAYLWWQVQLSDGRVGWSAESSLLGSFYFMEPR